MALRLVLALLAYATAAPAEHVRDGAPITPEFAQTLYARVGELREPDGCRLTRFDTSRYRITIGLVTPAGAEQFLDLATMPGLIPISRTAGDWAIGVPAPLARDCPTTVAAIERILGETVAPTGGWQVGSTALSSRSHYVLLARDLPAAAPRDRSRPLSRGGGERRARRRRRRAGAPVGRRVRAAPVAVAVAFGLRLWLSPRTFLHEYYHIAETVPAYLSGEVVPGYGKSRALPPRRPGARTRRGPADHLPHKRGHLLAGGPRRRAPGACCFAWPTLVAGAVFAVLLVPHTLDVMRSMREARSPAPHVPSMRRYFETLLLFDPRITPVIYPLMLVAGAAWAAIRRPGWLVWIVAVYVGFTVFPLSLFDNPPYHLRAQNLPTSCKFSLSMCQGFAGVLVENTPSASVTSG